MLYKWNILWQPQWRCVERLLLSLSLFYSEIQLESRRFSKETQTRRCLLSKFLSEAANSNRKGKKNRNMQSREKLRTISVQKYEICNCGYKHKIYFWNILSAFGYTIHIFALMYVWLKLPWSILILLTCNHFIFLDVKLLNAVRSCDPYVIRFLTVMALCNTVMPIKR